MSHYHFQKWVKQPLTPPQARPVVGLGLTPILKARPVVGLGLTPAFLGAQRRTSDPHFSPCWVAMQWCGDGDDDRYERWREAGGELEVVARDNLEPLAPVFCGTATTTAGSGKVQVQYGDGGQVAMGLHAHMHAE